MNRAAPSWLLGGLLATAPAQATEVDAVADRLRARLEAIAAEPSSEGIHRPGPPLEIEGEPLQAPALLASYYERRIYRPAWFAPGGGLERHTELLDAVRGVHQHGLEPLDYHLRALELLLYRAALPTPEDRAGPELLADLELIASDAFFLLGSHLLEGRVDPATLMPRRPASGLAADLARTLDLAAESGVRAALASLLPASPDYGNLQQSLVRHREAAATGGWPMVPAGPPLVVGAAGERVAILRRRLAATGDLAGSLDSPFFDPSLEGAVRVFQARHGLEVDGVVGPATRAALDVSAGERAAQIALNLERRRWLPRDLGWRHLTVNVPAFELRMVEDDATLMRMRAMVGKPYRQTPSFSATMTYLVLSPYWYVPPGMAVQDILPAARIFPPYLAKEGIRVFRGWGAEEREIDPGEVDWEALSAEDFPYRFRQEPGDNNPLGRIKFMFPNRYNVYLHDTPMRGLFEEPRRDFSSGCIRLEHPFDLAAHLLRGDARWTRDELVGASTIDAETTIPLPEPIPVHVVYWTAWAENGATVFREDIYGRDGPLAAALAAPLGDAALGAAG